MDIVTNLLEFIVGTVILKGIIAHSLAEYIVKYAKKFMEGNPRLKAVIEHEIAKVRAQGHDTPVEVCRSGQCATL